VEAGLPYGIGISTLKWPSKGIGPGLVFQFLREADPKNLFGHRMFV